MEMEGVQEETRKVVDLAGVEEEEVDQDKVLTVTEVKEEEEMEEQVTLLVL